MPRYTRNLSIDSVLRMSIYGGETVAEHIAFSVWSVLCRENKWERNLPHTSVVRVEGQEVIVETEVGDD